MPSCAEVALVNVPSCPFVALRMVPHVPMLPTAWRLRAPCCLYQCAIVHLCCPPCAKEGYWMIPPCIYVSQHLWPSCAHRFYPYCPLVVPIVCKVANVPIVCQSLCSQGVILLQKLPMSRCLCRPSCPCQCTPSVPKFTTTWCLCKLGCTCL